MSSSIVVKTPVENRILVFSANDNLELLADIEIVSSVILGNIYYTERIKKKNR